MVEGGPRAARANIPKKKSLNFNINFGAAFPEIDRTIFEKRSPIERKLETIILRFGHHNSSLPLVIVEYEPWQSLLQACTPY